MIGQPWDAVLIVVLIGILLITLITQLRPIKGLPPPPPHYRSSAIRKVVNGGKVVYVMREPSSYSRFRRVDVWRWGRKLGVLYGFRYATNPTPHYQADIVEIREAPA